MVIVMNKEKFIEALVEKTNLSKNDCLKISDCLEDNFLIGKNNKKKTINLLIERMNVTEEKADELYNIASSIIATAIKDKIKHPFRSQG